jgi:hypothetical protein
MKNMAIALVCCVGLGLTQAQATQHKKSTASAATGSSLARQLDACKADASWNPVKREKCVWRLCKNRWGKDGCPPEGAPIKDAKKQTYD